MRITESGLDLTEYTDPRNHAKRWQDIGRIISFIFTAKRSLIKKLSLNI